MEILWRDCMLPAPSPSSFVPPTWSVGFFNRTMIYSFALEIVRERFQECDAGKLYFLSIDYCWIWDPSVLIIDVKLFLFHDRFCSMQRTLQFCFHFRIFQHGIDILLSFMVSGRVYILWLMNDLEKKVSVCFSLYFS